MNKKIRAKLIRDMDRWNQFIAPLLRKVAFQCPHCLHESFEKFSRSRNRNHYEEFSRLPSVRNLPEKKEDIIVLHGEILRKGVVVLCDKCAGRFPAKDFSKDAP